MSFLIAIPRRASFCAHGQESFVPGMEYYSLLKENSEGILQRFDYCPACWKEIASNENAFWKNRLPLRQEVKENLPFIEMALEFLRQNALQNEKEEELAIYALYLCRKKKLHFVQEVIKEGKTFLIYEVDETEEMLFIPKVDISKIDANKIKEKLLSLSL